MKILSLAINVSVDCLLDTENETEEKVIETIDINGAAFDIVEKPATILAGKMIYAKMMFFFIIYESISISFLYPFALCYNNSYDFVSTFFHYQGW